MRLIWQCRIVAVAVLGLLAVASGACTAGGPAAEGRRPTIDPRTNLMDFPTPNSSGTTPIEAAIAGRRSARAFTDEPLTNAEIGQLLWASQGITDAAGKRTAPSAGALYPLEMYVVTADGLDHYLPDGHRLDPRQRGDLRADLARAALDQEAVGNAPAVFVIAAVEARTAVKYGARAERYVSIEVGHAAQNLLLQAAALGLAGVPVGAFDDAAVHRVLDLPDDEAAMYLVPVGHAKAD